MWFKNIRAYRLTSPFALSPEQLASVFKPFVSYKQRGLGVGLALARRIVQRYGGRLELRSQPGAGATAYLQLSLAE